LRQTRAKAVERAARSAGARIPRDVRAVPAAVLIDQHHRARGGEPRLMLSAPPVRSCSWALLRWGCGASARAQPAAGVSGRRASVPSAKGLRGSFGKPGPRPYRSTLVRPRTRCRSRHVLASVPPAPAGGSIPVSDDMVASRLAWRGNEVSHRCVPAG